MKAKASPKRKPEVGLRPKPQEADGRVMALALAEGELSGEMQAYFAKCDEKIGFVPNVARLLAITPDHFLRWWAYFDELMRGLPA